MADYEMIRNKVNLLTLFYQTYGREPKSRERFEGVQIGYFLSSIRKGSTKIEPFERKKLLKLGYRLEPLDIKEEVHKKVQLLKEFYLIYEKEPTSKIIYKNIKIGIFLQNIRRGVVKLSKADYNELLKIGYILKNKSSIMKERKLELLIEFFKEYMRVPRQDETFKGENIGYFLMNIKLGRTSVPEKYKEKLREFNLIK